MAGAGLYVYAVVRRGTPLPAGTGGVGDPPGVPRTVTTGGIAAVVSDAPARLRARRRDLLAHQNLLMGLAEGGPVLPMRFGMVAPDEDTLLARLAGARRSHLATLEQLDGHVEVNVKALPAPDSLAEVVVEDAVVRRLRDEARRRPGYEASVRLGEAVASALTRRAAEAGREVLRELAPLARAAVPGPEVQGCALNTSFLVPRGHSERFRTAAERLAEARRSRVEIRFAGPLPCYSFVGDADAPGRPGAMAGG
ncbi:GvpL/GvpF family gas vesicle protein [Streptomyces sp. NPDC059698]|uniref:GvpL/GvpF family gas vesicle protein n=1 Tax=unclassified Streptomyces TaxID=2593676 RepID=UPI00093C08EC|nr:GvpL/GvpF family gas vesicle protein [Streptomyces sp. CB02366]OKJ32667.1 gas vesicle protein [Streptomyces sp. CB02366]TVP37618.1 gas vesicle protein [Streptomyces griseus subsp. griseus]WSS54070.1 GvpL/GvpF family gas vesicle protein [Streptomyces sp. NBC_01178]